MKNSIYCGLLIVIYLVPFVISGIRYQYSPSSRTIQTTQCIEIGYECADSSQCCSNDCLHYADVHICIQKRPTTRTPPVTTTTPAVRTTTPPARCVGHGERCDGSVECCVGQCHMINHSCVNPYAEC